MAVLSKSWTSFVLHTLGNTAVHTKYIFNAWRKEGSRHRQQDVCDSGNRHATFRGAKTSGEFFVIFSSDLVDRSWLTEQGQCWDFKIRYVCMFECMPSWKKESRYSIFRVFLHVHGWHCFTDGNVPFHGSWNSRENMGTEETFLFTS